MLWNFGLPAHQIKIEAVDSLPKKNGDEK